MTSNRRDEKLVLRALQLGDHGAFEKLYQDYGKKLYWKLLQMVRDPNEAEEILQELFIRIWNRREQIDLENSFQAYLYSIAKSMVADHYRRLARVYKAEKELQYTHSEFSLVTEENLASKETEQLLQHAISRLSDQRRIAFVLCKIEGKSHKEAGEIMGISANTVHNHLVKACKAIRETLLLDHSLTGTAVLVFMVSTLVTLN
ncbi:RNA polymerase sigma factor [Chryseobacterium sp. 52]|uniref:RNA polymerase sigma factor n=1 Tax=Chryseobacterium sp. 52 TaxID=2035213 RepID=UPI000C193594|nr:sigma-70 family RNA polymerase sigma factor [Chryseobacterium sp. 52]